MKPLNPKTMNWIYIFFKHGWAVFLVFFLLVYASIFVEVGPDPVILQWTAKPMMSSLQGACMVVLGVFFALIAIFRFYESKR